MTARITVHDRAYPDRLRARLADDAPDCLYAMGDIGLLRTGLLGLVCSVRCPGSVVLKTFDAVRGLRDGGVALVGGFHSPMERESLDILLRGRQPVVLCPARGLARLRLGASARQGIKDGRLLVVSPFSERMRRTTSAQSAQRNLLVAALADALLVPYASVGGAAWATARAALDRGQAVFTFEVEKNKALLERGARAFSGAAIVGVVGDATSRDDSSTNISTSRDDSSTNISTRQDDSVDATSRRVDAYDVLPRMNYFNPEEPVAFLSGNLPHWRQEGATYFVTFRLADSIPKARLRAWLAEREVWLKTHPEPHDPATRAEYYQRFPHRLHTWLDNGYGCCILAEPDIKRLVERSLQFFHGERYYLDEFVVMPNHVHVLVAPVAPHELSDIISSWKSYTSHAINKMKGKTGMNWQKESFDHIVRNADSHARIRQYIRENPLVLESGHMP